ncbi:glycoside hydrolase family 27 protein [Novosphingobium decolorationis]|uniref:Alpha-galactosidase n=1 Tax=Novosphingobium decolorationis TaxID=2698673 RepID=A0ABX8E1Q6_9SPHN|nr:glycoside hydrolase family 27 protein [Novosphingobium decolorationis]QVM83070.1 glycoside hydrolase family 27 protein [Novosphingobium decolorationis]
MTKTSIDLSRRKALQAAAGLSGVVAGAVSLSALAATGAKGQAKGGAGAQAGTLAPVTDLAPRPPMGWNSWNSFAGTINEEQCLETAAIMAEKLLPFGYDVFTVDIQWYEPDATSYSYNPNPVPALDAHARLQPAPNRFPSAREGQGFAPLAAKVHALGLKFGIHVMRGIARHAVKLDLPIEGTPYTARDIADTSSVCPWNPDMYGVDMTRPGAQEYYDGLFRMYASWGVDFIKMDDMSRPYDAHAPEIEAAAKAIARCGRPMVLSLSPGETPVPRGGHVRQHAQMWRISDDFWDDWGLLAAQFTRLENWNMWMGPGSWPDADMLPLGRLALGDRDTKFTPDEQATLMTLWSIARSPLIMGGDLRYLDAATLALLTNPEVLGVNQNSTANAPHFLEDGLKVWTARDERGFAIYLALFNLAPEAREVSVPLDRVGLVGSFVLRDLWERQDRGDVKGAVSAQLPGHGAKLYKLTPLV